MDIIPQLNDRQLDRLSEFSANFSLLILASLVIPNIFGVDKPNMTELILGLMLTAGLLLASITILRRRHD